MIDFDVAYDKLASLETADEIADMFRGYGVKAIPRAPLMCAISVWLTVETGQNVRTGSSSLYKINKNSDGDYERCEEGYIHTPAMRDFVAWFDCSEYPDLIEDKYRNTYK